MATLDEGDAPIEDEGVPDEAQADRSTRSRRNRKGPRLYRHYKPIRDDPLHEKFGLMKDVMEHDYWCDKEREHQPGGWTIPFHPDEAEVADVLERNDEHVQAGQNEIMLEDPWVNGYLTEDEMMFNEEYKIQPYMPDKVKQQMYYLFCNEGWSVKRLSQRFGVRTERVTMILNMKRTEPDMKATGRYEDRVDEVFTDLYAGRFKDYVEQGENNDQGLNIAMLKDGQLPDDVLPRWNVPAKGSKLHWRLPRVPVPPREERTFKAKYVFKDINRGTGAGEALRVVDYDGTVRPGTKRETASRSWRMQRWQIKRDPTHDLIQFNPVTASAPKGTLESAAE